MMCKDDGNVYGSKSLCAENDDKDKAAACDVSDF